jgi:HEAT repeat protein
LRRSLTHRPLVAWVTLFVVLCRLTLIPALADGCFVFRWNKQADIDEPTQKAIIVHDAGREDLLLQVKYEGPLQDFGWLIPVPTSPTVEKGSMQPFYELSQLTQREGGVLHRGVPMPVASMGGREESVRVIEVKTVGAYEVAMLSAQDAGSLARWLKAHDYVIPQEKAGTIDEYIRKGWYFVAAKINLDKPVALQRAAGTTSKNTSPSAKQRKAIKKKLSSGELHPLLISFSTPKCIFPLRISAVGGKPSEVSLYVLSTEALLNRFIFDKNRQTLDQGRTEWEQTRPQRTRARERCEQNLGAMRVAWQLSQFRSRAEWQERLPRDWSLEDLMAISQEGRPPTPPSALDDDSYYSPHELVQCLRVVPEQLPQGVKGLPRLKSKRWYLTKQVWTFRREEMHDLEFQPVIPLLVAALPGRAGREAAALLTRLDARADAVLVAACQSTDAQQRLNASSGLQELKNPSLVKPLLTLLKDDVPQVRLNALSAAAGNWDPRFVAPLVALFRDPYPEIRQQAAGCLELHEPTNRAPAYAAMLRDPDPEVQKCALQVLSRIHPAAIPRAELLRLLGSPRLDTVTLALGLLGGGQPFELTSPPPSMAPGFPVPKATHSLSSSEAARLTTNQLTLARLMGLRVLRENADAQAVVLALPLLRDTNSIVRHRAFDLLHAVSGQDIPQDKPAKWDQWWATNKATFNATKPPR